MSDTQPASGADISKLIELIDILNTRTAKQEVRIALLENALASLLVSAHSEGIPELTNALELVKLDWIELGRENTKEDLISILRRGPSSTGPTGWVSPKD